MGQKVKMCIRDRFEGVTAQQFKEAVDDLESQGMEKLIIDLRNNPGGLLDLSLIHI